MSESKAKTLDIWTYGYYPMTLGGPVRRPIKTSVSVGKPADIGAGYSAHLIDTPSGATVVAEASSGALIGPSLDAARADVASANPKTMAEQIADAIEKRDRASRLEPYEFFRRLRTAG